MAGIVFCFSPTNNQILQRLLGEKKNIYKISMELFLAPASLLLCISGEVLLVIFHEGDVRFVSLSITLSLSLSRALVLKHG